MAESQKINCTVQGWQERTFVRQHIAQSLHTGVPVGFYWSSQDTSAHPDAWCSDCEEARLEAGGDWTPEVSAKLGIKLLCASCYDYAKSIWSHGRKVTQ
jgi:hypothetical protein